MGTPLAVSGTTQDHIHAIYAVSNHNECLTVLRIRGIQSALEVSSHLREQRQVG